MAPCFGTLMESWFSKLPLERTFCTPRKEITIPGRLIESIGLAAATPGDESDPGMVLKICPAASRQALFCPALILIPSINESMKSLSQIFQENLAGGWSVPQNNPPE
jgi:hypothetical protein